MNTEMNFRFCFAGSVLRKAMIPNYLSQWSNVSATCSFYREIRKRNSTHPEAPKTLYSGTQGSDTQGHAKTGSMHFLISYLLNKCLFSDLSWALEIEQKRHNPYTQKSHSLIRSGGDERVRLNQIVQSLCIKIERSNLYKIKRKLFFGRINIEP